MDPVPFFLLWFSFIVYGRYLRGTGGRLARPFLTWSFETRPRIQGDLPFRSRLRCAYPRLRSESSCGDFGGTVLPPGSSHDRKYIKDPPPSSSCGSRTPSLDEVRDALEEDWRRLDCCASLSSSCCSLPREQCVDEPEVRARIIGYLVFNYPIQVDLGMALVSRTCALTST